MPPPSSSGCGRTSRGCEAATDAVVEAIVFCLEELPREPRIGMLLQAEDDLFGRGITSATGIALAAQFLPACPWTGSPPASTNDDVAGLAELMLRLIGSLMQHPPGTPRSPDDVRAFLRRWLGPALVPVPAGTLASSS